MPLPEPWMSASEFNDLGKRLIAELEREVQPRHELAGRNVVPTAKCGGCDDAVLRLDDETGDRLSDVVTAS